MSRMKTKVKPLGNDFLETCAYHGDLTFGERLNPQRVFYMLHKTPDGWVATLAPEEFLRTVANDQNPASRSYITRVVLPQSVTGVGPDADLFAPHGKTKTPMHKALARLALSATSPSAVREWVQR